MASSQGDKWTAWTRQIIDLSGKTKTAADLDGASVSSSESALHRRSSTMPPSPKPRSSLQQQFPTKPPQEPPQSSEPKPFVKPAIPASHEKSPKSSTRVKIEETPRSYISNHQTSPKRAIEIVISEQPQKKLKTEPTREQTSQPYISQPEPPESYGCNICDTMGSAVKGKLLSLKSAQADSRLIACNKCSAAGKVFQTSDLAFGPQPQDGDRVLRVALLPQESIEFLPKLLRRAEREAWAAERKSAVVQNEMSAIQDQLVAQGRSLRKLEECMNEFGRATTGFKEVRKRVKQVRDEQATLNRNYHERSVVIESDNCGTAKKRAMVLKDILDGLV